MAWHLFGWHLIFHFLDACADNLAQFYPEYATHGITPVIRDSDLLHQPFRVQNMFSNSKTSFLAGWKSRDAFFSFDNCKVKYLMMSKQGYRNFTFIHDSDPHW